MSVFISVELTLNMSEITVYPPKFVVSFTMSTLLVENANENPTQPSLIPSK